MASCQNPTFLVAKGKRPSGIGRTCCLHYARFLPVTYQTSFPATPDQRKPTQTGENRAPACYLAGMNTVLHAAESPHPDEILIVEREAARRMSLSTRTLFALRQAGELPHVRVGSKILYDPRDLADFASRRKSVVGG